ncbi:MAG: PQQ-dependent sugar dehydrogenase, partial [Phycisphaerae bacterium]|nr:PQQ-dependent sugar dehydrogenase [Saprospiraceae bacterium]
TGNAQLLIDLSGKKNFPNHDKADVWPQGGLQGMAFHPDFNDNPYFYVAYVYRLDSCRANTEECYFKTKIVRYKYNMSTQTLSDELVIVDTIPGSTDHNGGRLAIGPIAEDMDFLFYGVGEMGAGQLGNSERPHHGQDPNYYEGKILRFNLSPDNDSEDFDQWIPNNNPFNTSDKQSAIWSLGHRNPQGLVFSPDGILYESEHGPYSDDEINIIERGHNYGFPLIMGFADGNYDGSRAGDGITMPEVGSEALNRTEIEQIYPYSDPLGSFFAPSQSEVSTLYSNDVNNTPPFANYYLYYPTIAPSGIDYYHSDAIPGWKNSLLVTNLKLASVFRLKLLNNGTSIVNDTTPYFNGLGRFRDLAISPDGTKIYVSTDSIGAIKGAPGESVQPPNKGCILEFTYLTTGTDEAVLNDKIQLFPNPTELGSTNLSLNLGYEAEVSVDLYDVAGKKITTLIPLEKATSIDRRIDMGPFQTGVYFLKVQVNDSTMVRKLVHI